MSSPASYLQEQFILPPASIQTVIRHCVLLTTADGAEPTTRTLLPNFQMVMLVNLGPTAELWHAAGGAELVPVQQLAGMLLIGPLKTALYYRLPAGARVLALNFTLDGFFRLFRVPVERLNGEFTDPDEVVGHRCFAELWEQLCLLPQPAQLIQAIADFCLPYLQQHAPESAQTELMAQLPLLSQSSYLNPVKLMASASKLSERTLQLRFQKYLGFSAKEAARFLRFRQVVEALQTKGGVVEKEAWFELLDHYGYYDQSHLIHDFTYFLQQSPTKVSAQLLNGDTICFTKTELL